MHYRQEIIGAILDRGKLSAAGICVYIKNKHGDSGAGIIAMGVQDALGSMISQGQITEKLYNFYLTPVQIAKLKCSGGIK